MERPLFSDMLLDRRRQLGLSIKQASNVLRLKEEVLIAFEEGDFDAIPKSGYAQGMLSSYARYLGLNAKTVVNQFSTDLFEHERGAGSHEARRRSRRNRDSDDGPLYETPQAAAVGQTGRRTYVESHGFLPTSGGFAGDMGDFATTSSPRPRYSSASRDSDDSYPQGRPYTSRVPMTPSVSPLGQSQRQRPTVRTTQYGVQDSYGSYARYGAQPQRDEVTTRRVMPSQYRDDMRLDNQGGTYQSASTSAGRRSSRNIANTQRPNVRRRNGSSGRGRGRSQEPEYGGLVGMIQVFFEDRSRVIGLIVVVLAIVLSVIIITSVRSCFSQGETNDRSVTVAEQKEDEKEAEQNAISEEEERRAREEAAAAKAAETESSANERTIEVTVDEGEVTWLEIEYDGNSDVAETVTGPWNRTYTVRQSISINVNDTSAVTVTENGKKLEFDSKASGIGTITIQVAKKGDSSDTTTDGEDTENKDGQDGNGTGSQQNGNQNGTSDSQTTNTQQSEQIVEGYDLAEDGYYYGPEGYYDADGNFYPY